jgi:hypothetical protein
MASALTGNKIKDSYQALLKMGTNGSLDPTTLITISDGLGNDTPLQLAGDKLATNYLGNINGLNIDLAGNNYRFGDINGNSAYLNIVINGSSLFGSEAVSLESNNKQVIVNNGLNQLIYTSNDNGTYSGDRGFKLDFSTNVYTFGDPNGIAYNGSLGIVDGESVLFSEDNYLGLFGPSLNTWLGYYPGSIYNGDVNANSNNYVFGSDWLMDNDDKTRYPFKYNTVLNCYNNGLDTYEKNMKYNLFVNIQDPNLDLGGTVGIQDDQILSNCFIFGLTNFIGNNALGIYSQEPNGLFFPTNVLILNGSRLEYRRRTNNVFSVNASEVTTADDTSGLVILGGDYYDKDFQQYITANHQFDMPGNIPYGISIQGNKALVKNTFTRVVANSFLDNSTARGKVQIEEKQVFKNIDDGSAFQSLIDSRGEAKIWLQSSASYFIELKIVSVSSSTVQTNSSGNWVKYIGGIICVDASGVLTIDEKTIVEYGQHVDMAYNIDISNNNCFIINIKPDTSSGDPCLVKADVKISCVTKN